MKRIFIRITIPTAISIFIAIVIYLNISKMQKEACERSFSGVIVGKYIDSLNRGSTMVRVVEKNNLTHNKCYPIYYKLYDIVEIGDSIVKIPDKKRRIYKIYKGKNKYAVYIYK